VHLDLPPELLPDGHVLATVDLGDLSVEDLSQMPAAPRTLSDTWLQEQRTPVLRVPSAIVPESPNLLLNPAHPEASTGRILDARRFTFDPRLWRPRRGGRCPESGGRGGGHAVRRGDAETELKFPPEACWARPTAPRSARCPRTGRPHRYRRRAWRSCGAGRTGGRFAAWRSGACGARREAQTAPEPRLGAGTGPADTRGSRRPGDGSRAAEALTRGASRCGGHGLSGESVAQCAHLAQDPRRAGWRTSAGCAPGGSGHHGLDDEWRRSWRCTGRCRALPTLPVG
jgi:hypothetical protein